MTKWIIAALAALILAFGGWYFASPALALRGLQQAAREGDADELRTRVDFPALRESLKEQLRARMATDLARSDQSDNPFGQIGAMLAMGMVDGMVETFVSPEAISRIVLQAKRDEAARPAGRAERAASQASEEPTAAGPPDVVTVDADDPEWKVVREGLDRFTLEPAGPDVPADAPRLIFARDGLGWKLVGIDMQGALPETR